MEKSDKFKNVKFLFIAVFCFLSLFFLFRFNKSTGEIIDKTPPIFDPPVNKIDGAPLILIPRGVFQMGAAGNDPIADIKEKPLRKVYLEDFYIYRFEVTRGQFKKFVDSTGYVTTAEKLKKTHNWRSFTNDKTMDRPVLFMSWNDAEAYARWAGGELPTEAQWEKAARGTDVRIYPWGDRLSPELFNNDIRPDNARFPKDSSTETEDENPVDFARPAGSYPRGASPFGVMDLIGNAYEFCRDWYGPYTDDYRNFAVHEPSGPAAGSLKIIKGGGNCDDIRNFRISARDTAKVDEFYCDFGFRLVLSLSDYEKMKNSSQVGSMKKKRKNLEIVVNLKDEGKILLLPFKPVFHEKNHKTEREGIYTCRVTAKQFRLFCQKTGGKFSIDFPVDENSAVSVLKEDAENYCRWAGGTLPDLRSINLFNSFVEKQKNQEDSINEEVHKGYPDEWFFNGKDTDKAGNDKKHFRVYFPEGSIQ